MTGNFPDTPFLLKPVAPPEIIWGGWNAPGTVQRQSTERRKMSKNISSFHNQKCLPQMMKKVKIQAQVITREHERGKPKYYIGLWLIQAFPQLGTLAVIWQFATGWQASLYVLNLHSALFLDEEQKLLKFLSHQLCPHKTIV